MPLAAFIPICTSITAQGCPGVSTTRGTIADEGSTGAVGGSRLLSMRNKKQYSNLQQKKQKSGQQQAVQPLRVS